MKRFLVTTTSEIEINVFLEFSCTKKLDFHSLLFLDSKLQMPNIEGHVKLLSTHDFTQINLVGIERSRSPVVNSEIEPKVIWALEIFLEMLKRQDSHKNSTYEQRREIFSIQISFWTEYLKQNQINCVFFSTCPHEVIDFSLYLVAKALEIEVIILQDNHVLGRKIAVDHIFAPWNSIIGNNIIENKKVSIEEIRQILERAKNLENPAWVFNSDDRKSFSLKNLKAIMVSLGAGLNLAFMLSILVMIFWISHFVGKSNQSILNFISKYTYRCRNYISMLTYLYENTRLKQIRSDFLIRDLPKVKFVTLFLNYNPEMMLNPLGYPFNRDMNVISKVRSLIPSDCSLLVREHPSQYSPGYGYLGRNLNFYSAVSSFPNTFVIGSDFPLSKILDSSAIVFTLNGTVGWQAAARGVKVGIMGNAWFEGIPNSMRIYQETTSEDVMKWSENSLTLTADSLEEFLIAVFENSFQYIQSKELALITGHSWDLEVNKGIFSRFIKSIL